MNHSDLVTIKVKVTREQHKHIKEAATKHHMTMSNFILLRLLDDSDRTCEQRTALIQQMPVYYRQVQEIQDSQQRSWFMDFGGALWPCLK